MPGSILFVGDIHLGRRPTRLPVDLADHGLRPSDLGPVAAWRRAVSHAIAEGIDVVVLAGDVVDQDNRLFEAQGPLDAGVRELVDAGVRVLAVAGNHDGDGLPRLARAMDGFRLLGSGGTWETVSLRARGAGDDDPPFARLVGWSFPGPRVGTSPVADFVRPPAAAVPTFGVLHCDLDQAQSTYAPVARTELETTGLDGWFLGHIHAPSPLEGDRPIGYLGSLTGLDPGEPGAHGPVRVDVDGAGRVRVRRLAMAPLRWERVEVRLDEPGDALESADELPARLTRALEHCRERIDDDAGGTRAIGCRVVLRGRTRAHDELRRVLGSDLVESLRLHRDGVLLFAEKIVDESQAAIDLEALAAAPTPPGRLARHLIALERAGDPGAPDDPDVESLLHDAGRRLATAAGDRAWIDLPPAALDREAVRALLLGAGREALEEMLRQSPGEPGA